jgi:hypothetical protein
MVTVDFSRNKKQQEFFEDVLATVHRHKRSLLAKRLVNEAKTRALTEQELTASQYTDPLPYRIIAYGGAIRGGKTYVSLAILVLLCKMYPGSRWHIIRASMPDLIRNVEPSLKRILGQKLVRWKRSKDDYYVEFTNGARIYFMGENFNADKDLDRFKGLETNGVLMEQAEELQHATFTKCMERVGSWYINDQPPGLVMMTFNPAFNWVKDVIYDPWEAGNLSCPFYYKEALPDDNGFVTEDQWAMWKNMDERTYARFIRGAWDIELEGRFAWAFTEKKHVGRLQYRPDLPLRFSFDFNVDPSCAVAFQTDGETFFHVLREYRIPNGDTYRLCEAIADEWRDQDPYIIVHGDAAGNARMSGARGAVSQYHIIQSELAVPWSLFHVPRSNPTIADSRVLTNSVIQRMGGGAGFVVDESCKFLRHDLNFCVIRRNKDGHIEIQKTGALKHAPLGAESMGHLLDCVRYGITMNCHDFVHIHRS